MSDLGHLRGEFLAPLQRPPRPACALGVAPHEFVGIKLGGVARHSVSLPIALPAPGDRTSPAKFL